ncbi:MAG: cyclophane-forming radical SAM/SPASM peptide maturase GrrM/OscB [Cyanobacteria bacterium P01_F01_bin.150]
MSLLDTVSTWFHGRKNYGPIQLVIIQPTTFCNLNCSYCYLPDRHLKHEFSLDLLEPIFTHLFQSQFLDSEFTVVWHAGEPLTMPVKFYQTTFEKIEQLNQNSPMGLRLITHAIQTNATLINDQWCDLIKTYGIRIGVSLDGPEFLHDAYRLTRRGLGSYKYTMRGVRLLQQHNIPFHVIAVLTRDGLDYPDELFQFFVDQNIQQVGFNIDEMEGTHQASSLSSDDSAQKYKAFMIRMLALTKENPGVLQIRELEETKQSILGKTNIQRGQFTPFTMLNIAYNGDFSTFSPELLSMDSEVYGDFILGNIVNQSFDKVCQTPKFKHMNRDIQAGVSLCKKTCEYFSVCGGGAPSNKYFENGSFNSSETMYCKYTKKILTDIVLADLEETFAIQVPSSAPSMEKSKATV